MFVPDNNYGHVETVRQILHTWFTVVVYPVNVNYVPSERVKCTQWMHKVQPVNA